MESEKEKSPIAEPVEGSSSTPERLPMARNGYGTSGYTREVSTNYLRVLMNPPKNADYAFFYRYTVSLKYKKGHPANAKDIGREVMNKVRETHRDELGGVRFVYDGDKSLVTIRPLPKQEFQFDDVALEDASSNRRTTALDVGGDQSDRKRSRIPYRSKTFIVNINFANRFSMDSIAKAANGEPVELSQDAVRVLDIILRQHSAEKNDLVFRQSFFKCPKELNFTGVVGVLKGFSSSFRATQGGLFLNMDVSHTLIVQPGPVLNFIFKDQNIRDENIYSIDWNKAKRVLQGLRVKIKHSNEECKISGLSEKPCREETFQMKQRKEGPNGQEVKLVTVTIHEYFVNHKNVPLEKPGDLPCVNVGKSQHPVYIPIELCSLVPLQRYTKALSTEQRSLLVNKSRRGPGDRMEDLKQAMLSQDYDSNTMFSDSGISIRTQFTCVDGRILPAPKLKSGNGDLNPQNGRWNFNNQTLAEPAQIDSWLVADFSSNCDMKRLIKDLIMCAQMKGISIEHPTANFTEKSRHRREQASVRVDKMIRTMKEKLKPPPTFILCVLPQKKNCDIYGPWKRRCLSDYGVPTQCIAPTLLTNQILTNVVLKINAKIGGLNFLLRMEDCSSLRKVSTIPTLILGMDVSHGPPGQAHMPSIAAVVSSRNWPSISHYRAAVRTQFPKCEMIDSLFEPQPDSTDTGIIRAALRDFRKTSESKRPEQIIIFRDGVGESQFKDVLNKELKQIIDACKVKDNNWCPKFTVIVAQKRHNTRFFQQESNKPFKNVPPGMIVDQKICHPTNNDFYLCAHAGIIGTSRPAHYHVLLDEIGFTVDELQQLVHSLCYIYQRSTTAVSVVAPIGYAHLAAAQIAQMIKPDQASSGSSSSSQAAASSSQADASSSSQAAAAAAASSSQAAAASSSSQAAAASSSSQAAAAAPLPELPHFPKEVAKTMFFC